MQLTLTIELTFDENAMHGNDPEEREWFYSTILLGKELILHSNKIGDTVGTVKVVGIGAELAPLHIPC